jgi:hypothetical protein
MVLDIVQGEGGTLTHQDSGLTYGRDEFEGAEPLEWVTQLTTYNRQRDPFAAYENEPTLRWAYGDVSL